MKTRVMSAFGAAALLMGATLPAFAQTAVTDVLYDEAITDIKTHNLPTPPVHPAKFTLPMNIQVVKDAAITTNTPITDQYATDLTKWAELVRESLKSKPVLVRVVGDQSVPFIVNGSEGKIKLNANDKPVFPL